ncbi:MAG: PqqD family protein [Polyangiaceae bacterium]|nr:PqqD family protein [Polyangiaceae bacterium]
MTRAPEKLDPSQMLDLVPAANRAVRAEERGQTLILYVPIQRRWWMRGPFGWLLPFRKEKGIALDSLGREVWEACDGTRTIEDIAEGFAARHRVRFHEAKLSVTTFLRSLVERRVVVLVLTEPVNSQ